MEYILDNKETRSVNSEFLFWDLQLTKIMIDS